MAIYGNLNIELENVEFIEWIKEEANMDVIQEGINMTLISEFSKTKKEYKKEIKVFKQAIKDKDKKEAKASKERLVKIIKGFEKFCNDHKEEIESKGAVVAIVAKLVKMFILIFLTIFLSIKADKLYKSGEKIQNKYAKTDPIEVDTLDAKTLHQLIEKEKQKGKELAEADRKIKLGIITSIISPIFAIFASIDGFSTLGDMNKYNSQNTVYIKLMKQIKKFENEINKVDIESIM